MITQVSLRSFLTFLKDDLVLTLVCKYLGFPLLPMSIWIVRNCFLVFSTHLQVMLEQVESLKPIAAIEARGKVVEPQRMGTF